jgi:hypothetical protein
VYFSGKFAFFNHAGDELAGFEKRLQTNATY